MRGPDIIEKDLQGRRRLGAAISGFCNVSLWRCDVLALCCSGVVSCDIKSGDVIYGDN